MKIRLPLLLAVVAVLALAGARTPVHAEEVLPGYAFPPSGGGSGTISSGTTGAIPKYTGATTIGDSALSDFGAGEFGLSNGTHSITLSVGAQSTNQALNIPNITATDTLATLGLSNNFSVGQTITGSADAVQLTVKGNATQTANLQEWKNSANSVLSAIGPAGRTLAPDGSVSAPGLSFLGETNSGFYRSGTNILNLSVNNSRCLLYTGTFEGHANGYNLLWYSAGFAGLVAGIEHTSGTNILSATDGASGGGWIRNTAGDLLVNADQAVDSATLTNATSLVTVSIATTRKIAFEAYLPFTAGDTVADGVKIDFAQGTATATYFIADAELVDGAGFATLTNPRSSALNTAISVAATTNTNFVIKVRGALVVNGAGTFGVRFAKVADAGTGLTLKRGAWLWLKDMP